VISKTPKSYNMKTKITFESAPGMLVGALLTTCILCLMSNIGHCQQSNDDLTKKLNNPVASLISIPFQDNTEVGIGANNGYRNTLNIQPVIPFSFTPQYNIVTRIVAPIIFQNSITARASSQQGLSDVVASAFLSPVNIKNGWIWGAGAAFLLPTATNDLLGTKKWGGGPTAVLLKQTGSLTIGTLVNQIWSYAGSAERQSVNQMYILPFITYNWKSGAGIGATSDITKDWKNKTTTAVITPTVSGVTRIGGQTIQLLTGPIIPLAAPTGQKPDFGIRASIVLVFPR
jgi:hypothetical protein